MSLGFPGTCSSNVQFEDLLRKLADLRFGGFQRLSKKLPLRSAIEACRRGLEYVSSKLEAAIPQAVNPRPLPVERSEAAQAIDR